MTPIETFEFHHDTSSPSDGESYLNSNADEATIHFKGTCSSFEAIFEGKVNKDAEWTPIAGANLETLDVSTNVSALKTSWNLSIEGFATLRVRLLNISGGNINVVGRMTSVSAN